MAASFDRRKRALIIVNSNYHSAVNRLTPADQNGVELADALQRVGFRVIVACDLEKQAMTLQFIRFAETIEDGDLALVYYSGHAYEVKGTNYLIPVDDECVQTERDVDDFSVNFNRMLRRFKGRHPSSAHVFILDCCRPYISAKPIESRGLAAMEPVDGCFIQLACAARATTRKHRFAKHLLQNITRENVPITDLFRDIAHHVSEESHGKQQPLSIDGLKQNEEIYLNYKEKTVGKEQAQLKAHYDSFPRFEQVFDADNDDIRKAEEFTRALLAKPPSGDVDDRQTVFHVINQIFVDEGEQCLFFDSSQGVHLHNTFGNLADQSLESKPFVLQLENLDGLLTEGENTSDEPTVIETLNGVIQENGAHPMTEQIIERIAKALNTNKENVVLKCVYSGSVNIVFAITDPKWEGLTLKARFFSDKKQMEKKIKEQFDQFKALRVHPLFQRPTFDVNDFDAKGNNSFIEGASTFPIGPPGHEQTYTQPAGFIRFGWNVLSKYATQTWLDPFQHAENWYRAYHGTRNAQKKDFKHPHDMHDPDNLSLSAAFAIYKEGFEKARVKAYGPGVYCSPTPDFVDLGYAGTAYVNTEKGRKSYKIMLQVAVNPDGVTITTDKNIWVVEQPANIRTYGLLIKDISSPQPSS